MKISRAFRRAIAEAAKQLDSKNHFFLSPPFQDNFVTLEKPEESKNSIQMQFRNLDIDRDGEFYLVVKIM